MSLPTSTHAKLSFSARKRWAACPASVALSQGQPDSSSDAAEEGTSAHNVAEFYVRQRFNQSTSVDGLITLPLEQVPPAGLDVDAEKWNDQLRRHGQGYVDYIQSLIPDGAEAFVTVEQRVAIPSLSGNLYGTADCIVWVPTEQLLIVVDYKYGFEDVSCGDEYDTNPQLAAYMVAAAETFNLTPARMVVAIYQPRRVTGRAGQSLELPAEWLTRERLLLGNEVAAVTTLPVDLPQAGLMAGDHCRYCKAVAVCPRTHDALVATLNDTTGLRSLHDMPDEDVVQLWAARTAFKAFWEDVQQRIDALAKAGHPSFQTTRRRGRRVWTDADAVVKTLLDLGLHDALAPKTLSTVYDQLPVEARDALVRRAPDSVSFKLVKEGSATDVAKIFKKYSKVVDSGVQLD